MLTFGERYFEEINNILERIQTTQAENIEKSAKLMATAIHNGNLVHVFGSAHSAIPVLEVFPRYGSFVASKGGFHPLLNPRLLWSTVVGAGGVKDLLWLERVEGYIENFLDEQGMKSGDVLLVFSHGGLNSAPIESAIYAKKHGLLVVAVTCMENQKVSKSTHSSGKKLSDIADIVIDNCTPSEDAVVKIDGLSEKICPSTTVAIITILQSLIAQVAGELLGMEEKLDVFVSPNVAGIPLPHNRKIFAKYSHILAQHARKEEGYK